MPTSLEQLLRYCQETHGKAASLLEFFKKKEKRKRGRMLHADVLFDINKKQPVAPAGIVVLPCSQHMF